MRVIVADLSSFARWMGGDFEGEDVEETLEARAVDYIRFCY